MTAEVRQHFGLARSMKYVLPSLVDPRIEEWCQRMLDALADEKTPDGISKGAGDYNAWIEEHRAELDRLWEADEAASAGRVRYFDIVLGHEGEFNRGGFAPRRLVWHLSGDTFDRLWHRSRNDFVNLRSLVADLLRRLRRVDESSVWR